MIALMPFLTLIAALGTGLMAGLFFAFSSFIMTALAKLPPEQGIAAMNSINVTILNATFSLAFFGTAVLCLGLGIASVLRWAEPGSAWLLAGSLLYLAGVIVVTMVFNVPLNDALAAVSPGASPEGAALWTRYLAEWLPWNHVRTFANIGALIAFILAYGRQAA
ncbi:putative membrane protein [Phyllobacterium sp. 1468]|uniref:anthrone oxygenase family protein n=1 Tax=Phyllobacterium sp. 1468 TaxID=2817759 RepID=UPI0028566B4F|nr:anthrone oxygenase family protein [Phyllobacterium sp. 1468]MDR6632460.1 putative membrane protein [Phyllobacterium sp. 1468]